MINILVCISTLMAWLEQNECLQQFIQKLWRWDATDGYQKVLDIYSSWWSAIVNFAYFAVLVKWGLLDDNCTDFGKQFLEADIIFPDGIALNLWAKKYLKQGLANLNGDDFLRWFFKWLDQQGIDYKVIGYWGKDDAQLIQKTKQEFQKISKKWFEKFFHWYQDLPWNEFEKLKEFDGLKFLVQSRWWPQEKRSLDNRDKIKEWGFVVFNVWWLFDHRWWAEPRPPKLLQKAKLEWLRRAIIDPKKNRPKVKDSLRVFVELLKRG